MKWGVRAGHDGGPILKKLPAPVCHSKLVTYTPTRSQQRFDATKHAEGPAFLGLIDSYPTFLISI